ncbi:MAG: 16S rRNA (adenine(1518)-N(6)/adenine(1519)-N(6))-dimethyltransferase RsmA [Candidatus Tumulicola sp.]
MTGSAHPRALLARWGLRPQKRYGQNFLIEAATAQRIAHVCLSSRDTDARTRVAEIGAGTGALTLALLEAGAEVTAIEIDPGLVALLQSREALRGAAIVHADALEFDYASWSRGAAWRVAGNLPYHIATQLVVRFAEMPEGPETLTVMVQKDVADRLIAAPGTAAYGSLSVAVRYAMHVERAFTLGPNAFYPAPKVRSSVVQMVRRDKPAVEPRDLALFRKVVRGAFAYRRKTLVNSLALALKLPNAAIARAIAASNLSPELRGERLDLDDFARLADALAQG